MPIDTSAARLGFMIRDRLSWMRFLGLHLGAPTPDENTIRHVRNRLTETGTLKRAMKAFDGQLKKKGYFPMAGQIVDVRGPGRRRACLGASIDPLRAVHSHDRAGAPRRN